MKTMKKLLCLMLAAVMLFGMMPIFAAAAEEDCIYLSISYDGKYIDDKNGNTIAYIPVPMAAIEAIDLTEYGLENMLFDGDGDGEYDTTALQLLIYAHEEIYGGNWSDVDFDAIPGSSYFKDGIFGFTENLVYFHNGDFPVDASQESDFMTVGATSDRIVLEAGDFLDVASFGCFSFLWDMDGGFHFFGDEEGNYVHDYAVKQGEALPVRLIHSFCDLMYGQAWTCDATGYTVYYGKTFGEAEGTVETDDSGMADITFPEDGIYYIWCDGANSSDEFTHSACDYYFETGMPCIVSAPGYARVTVTGEDAPAEIEKFDIAGCNMTLGNELELNIFLPKAIVDAYGKELTATVTHHAVDEDVIYTWKVSELPEYSKGMYYKASVRVAAAQMTDLVDIVVTDEDGNVYNKDYTTSVRTYVTNNLEKQNAKTKTLLVDMVNYGAAAQDQFTYRQDDYANAELTEVQKALATPTVECENSLVKGTNYKGSNLSLQDRILLNFFFKAVDDATLSKMYATVEFTGVLGNEVKETVKLIKKSGYTCVAVDQIVLADAVCPVTVTVYNADGTVYAYATDSVESYNARQNPNGTNALYTNIMKFAAAALAYKK